MIRFLRKLAGDRRGVSAVEFALIAPAMIAFYFGLAEITQALLAERRAGHVAAAVGDLVTQSSELNETELGDIFSIAKTIMQPFPATSNDLSIRVTSITASSTGVTRVDWSYKSGSELPLYQKDEAITVPTGVVGNSQSVVMSEVRYVYASPVKFFVPNGITFQRKFYLRPRKSDKVLKV